MTEDFISALSVFSSTSQKHAWFTYLIGSTYSGYPLWNDWVSIGVFLKGSRNIIIRITLHCMFFSALILLSSCIFFLACAPMA